MKSSTFRDGSYDLFFYGLIRGLQPRLCVELGTYAGKSASLVGEGLLHNGFGELHCYDLWDLYSFNHVNKDEAQKNTKGLPVYLHQEDAETVFAHYQYESVDYLFIDISNNGDTYRKYLRSWYLKLKPNAVVVMEGGIPERDAVEWMIKYRKPPIMEAFNDEFIKDHYSFSVVPIFPGMSVFRRRV